MSRQSINALSFSLLCPLITIELPLTDIFKIDRDQNDLFYLKSLLTEKFL